MCKLYYITFLIPTRLKVLGIGVNWRGKIGAIAF
jgi:hypothetical protein